MWNYKKKYNINNKKTSKFSNNYSKDYRNRAKITRNKYK